MVTSWEFFLVLFGIILLLITVQKRTLGKIIFYLQNSVTLNAWSFVWKHKIRIIIIISIILLDLLCLWCTVSQMTDTVKPTRVNIVRLHLITNTSPPIPRACLISGISFLMSHPFAIIASDSPSLPTPSHSSGDLRTHAYQMGPLSLCFHYFSFLLADCFFIVPI